MAVMTATYTEPEAMPAMALRLGSAVAQSELLAALEADWPDLYDHSERVARSATTLACAMGLPADDVRTVRNAALLHEIGALLVDIPALAGTAPIVAAVHEPYDRRSSDIPLAARITAVADAYDTLTTKRQDGTPMSSTEANAELVRRSGSDFDPAVVQTWIQKVYPGLRITAGEWL